VDSTLVLLVVTYLFGFLAKRFLGVLFGTTSFQVAIFELARFSGNFFRVVLYCNRDHSFEIWVCLLEQRFYQFFQQQHILLLELVVLLLGKVYLLEQGKAYLLERFYNFFQLQ
jgi:hypothetical protein